MIKRFFIALIVSSFLLSTVGFAQAEPFVESAPMEPPYVDEDFEGDFNSELSGDVPPPPSESNVDAMAKSLEEEMNSLAEPELNQDQVVDENIQNSELAAEAAAESEPVPEIVMDQSDPVEVAPNRVFENSNIVGSSKSGGVEYIRHPQAAEGLIAITKDGAYIYDIRKKTTSKESGNLKLGSIDSPRIYSADGTSFDEMYGAAVSPYIMFDYEWKPFNGFGSLGLQLGLGLLYSEGNGRFIDSPPGANEAKEKYNFFALPLNAGLVYRLQWADRQWLAPYVAGGGTYISVMEMRDDGAAPNLVGTPGAYGAFGVMFNVTALSRNSAVILNSEYGIKNMWLTAEYRRLQTFTDDLDFSANVMSAGISVDY